MADLKFDFEDGGVRMSCADIGEGTVSIPAEDLDNVLATLAECRRRLVGEEDDPQTTGPIKSVPNPRWFVQPTALNEAVLLHLADPRFGWLNYYLPKHEAHRMGQLLQGAANAPITPSGPAN